MGLWCTIFSTAGSVGLRCGLLVRVGIMAGERVTARKRKAGGKVVIKNCNPLRAGDTPAPSETLDKGL